MADVWGDFIQAGIVVTIAIASLRMGIRQGMMNYFRQRTKKGISKEEILCLILIVADFIFGYECLGLIELFFFFLLLGFFIHWIWRGIIKIRES